MIVIKPLGLYIHIPFCQQKCLYCDFNSYAGLDEIKEDYVAALIKEITSYSDKLDNRIIKTVYIGGGTPTTLSSDQIDRILEQCRKQFNFAEDCEVTIESNPGTLSGDMLSELKTTGINRLSMGLQSANNFELEKLGRIHRFEDFVSNFLAARESGFDNINVDLMFGLPDQTLDMWFSTLHKVIELKPEHISCYSLKVEENTPFYSLYEKDCLPLPDEATDREMYSTAISELNMHGYEHYEISNFALEGRESNHNLVYWTCGEYVGVGAGSHSYLGGERFGNIQLPREYIRAVLCGEDLVEEKALLTTEDRMAEYMFLGLRLMKGIDEKQFHLRFQKELTNIYGSQLTKLISLGLVGKNGHNYQLTRRGIDLSNQVFVEFI